MNSPESASNIDHALKENADSVVKIIVRGSDPQGNRNVIEGSGFVVYSSNSTLIMTASHVIGSSSLEPSLNKDWLIEGKSGRFRKIDRRISVGRIDANNIFNMIDEDAIVLFDGSSQNLDIAILSVRSKNLPCASLPGLGVLSIGSYYDVVLLGFLRDKNVMTSPPVASEAVSTPEHLLTRAGPARGESGGPWIDMKSGAVLAIASSTGHDNERHEGIGVPITRAIGEMERIIYQNEPDLRDLYRVLGGTLYANFLEGQKAKETANRSKELAANLENFIKTSAARSVDEAKSRALSEVSLHHDTEKYVRHIMKLIGGDQLKKIYEGAPRTTADHICETIVEVLDFNKCHPPDVFLKLRDAYRSLYAERTTSGMTVCRGL